MFKFISNNSFFIDESIYILCGIISIITAIKSLKNENARLGTFLFWTIVGIIFSMGGFLVKYSEYGGAIIGLLLFSLAILTITKQVKIGNFKLTTDEERRKNADKLGNLIFIPSLLLGILAVLLYEFRRFKIVIGNNDGKDILFGFTTAQVLGLSSILALIVAIIITKPKFNEIKEDTSRLLMQVGSSSLLPQLLGALGTVFAAAGVGKIIGIFAGGVVGSGGRLVGVIVYCLSMMLFTMIMGNAFAAFTVITLGVGIPFVIMQGGNPAIVGALGLTAGYCGTLITPMGANFNIVPASILEIKDKYKIIKTQLPMGISLLIVHIVLMLLLAF